MQTIFALCYRPGPAWRPGKSVFEQPLKEQRSYMRSLVEAGSVVLGGPYSDNTGGLVALEAASRESDSGNERSIGRGRMRNRCATFCDPH